MTIHNQETRSENELFIGKQGEFLQFYRELNIDASLFPDIRKDQPADLFIKNFYLISN